MSAIDSTFQTLRAQGRKALMPFITAGDPDLAFTAEIMKELAARGSSFCELGIPYSDPIADGPVIQASYTRSLSKKIKLQQILDMLRQTTPELSSPVVTMVSYAIVYRRGSQQFIDQARAAGVAGAIVPDLPMEEAESLGRLCRAADFALVQLVTPTTPRPRALRIAETSSGFLYYVSVAGITGERTELPQDLVDNVSWLRENSPLPICIGFGISRPEHVRLLKPVADGLIVGSAIVRRMAEAESRPRAAVLKEVGEYVESLMAELNPSAATTAAG